MCEMEGGAGGQPQASADSAVLCHSVAVAVEVGHHSRLPIGW
jgi:hypothetical protein